MEQHSTQVELIDIMAARQAYISSLALNLKKPLDMDDLRLIGGKKRRLTPQEHATALERLQNGQTLRTNS